MKVLLIVTWIVTGAQPSNYHIEFESLEKCVAARDDLLQDRERIIKRMAAVPLGQQFPALSAICAYQ